MKFRTITFLLLFVVVAPAYSADTPFEFGHPQHEQRYKELVSELRCMVCQNQTLADSHAPLAQDLRDEIYKMVIDESPKQEIIDFLVARYGEFVLYNPRKSGKTLILWITPALLIGVGGFIIVRVVRERMKLPIDNDVTES